MKKESRVKTFALLKSLCFPRFLKEVHCHEPWLKANNIKKKFIEQNKSFLLKKERQALKPLAHRALLQTYSRSTVCFLLSPRRLVPFHIAWVLHVLRWIESDKPRLFIPQITIIYFQTCVISGKWVWKPFSLTDSTFWPNILPFCCLPYSFRYWKTTDAE